MGQKTPITISRHAGGGVDRCLGRPLEEEEVVRIRSGQISAIIEALSPNNYKGWKRSQLLALGLRLRQGDMGVFEEIGELDALARDAIEQRALSELDLHEAFIARAKARAGSARQVYPGARVDLDLLLLLLCAIGRSTVFINELEELDKAAARAGLCTKPL
jgi:hypothetical protein